MTVDLIATGTDVKPLECLLFMRNINSASYFEQMKGRGCRVIRPDDLQSVTPDAKHKTHFVIVDAVGVCERDKTASKPLDRKPTVALDKILDMVGKGAVNADIVSTLAARLTRLDCRLSDGQRQEIAKEADGNDLKVLCADLLTSIDPDTVLQQAAEKHAIPEGQEPTEQQIQEVEQEQMQQALKPLHNPKLRDALLRTKTEQVIDEETPDELISAGQSKAAKEKAQTVISNFRQFIEDNRDEIEALKVLYSRPYRAGLRYRQVKELAAAIEQPPVSAGPLRLWQAYETVEPKKVRGHGGRQLVDVIALVRHAIDPNQPLVPVGTTVEERYGQWIDGQEAAGASFTPEQRQWLDAIKDHIAASLSINQDDFGYAPFNQLGGLGRAHELFGDHLNVILSELNEVLAA